MVRKLLCLAISASLVMFSAAAVLAAPVDFSPLVNEGVSYISEIALAAGVAVLSWVGRWAVTKFKVSATILDNELLHAGLQRGADALEDVIESYLRQNPGRMRLEIDNPVIASVAKRMSELSPDLLRRLKVSDEALEQLAAEKVNATTRAILAQRKAA